MNSGIKTIEQLKAEIAKEIGEPNGFDFQFEVEVDIGGYKTARALYKMLVDRYIAQFTDPDDPDDDDGEWQDFYPTPTHNAVPPHTPQPTPRNR